jgi:hypothetical protein
MLMQSENLTDEQLWQAIAQNTNAMTPLIHQQLELDPAVNRPNGITRQAKLRESNAERIGKLERNYREYTAELRRRYSLESQESANSTISGSDAATSMLSNTSVVIAGSP